MKFKLKQIGFTLIELIIVIIIIGILAAIALPKLVDLRKDAEIAKLKTMAGALASATHMNYGKWLATADKPYLQNGQQNTSIVDAKFKDAGFTRITGCVNNGVSTQQDLSLLMQNSNEISFDNHRGGALANPNAKYIIGLPGSAGDECMGSGANGSGYVQKYRAVECILYSKDFAQKIHNEFDCTEDNYCVKVQITCASGYPVESDGIYKSLDPANLAQEYDNSLKRIKDLEDALTFPGYADMTEQITAALNDEKVFNERLKAELDKQNQQNNS